MYVTKMWINPLPVNVSLSPDTGSIMIDRNTNLESIYWEPNGCENIKNCCLMINTGTTTSGAGYFFYDAENNLLYLRNTTDDAFLGGYAPGTNQIIDNGAIKLYCADTTVDNSGNNMIINWSIALKPFFSRNTCIASMQVTNKDDLSNTIEEMGVFNVLLCETDLLIKSGTESSYSGTDIYSDDGSNQAKSQNTAPNQKVTYAFKVKNAGDANDSFKITGPGSVNGWNVRYYESNTGAEVTSQVTGSGWSSGTLTPGATRGIFVNVKPDSTLSLGATNTLLIKAESEADDSKIDVVKAITTFTGIYKTDMLIKSGPETSYSGAIRNAISNCASLQIMVSCLHETLNHNRTRSHYYGTTG